MVTSMITLKLEKTFLKEIDSIVKNNNYQNRTEFIRNALRDKVEKTKTKEIIKELLLLKGASKKKTTNKELSLLRKLAFEELEQQIK